MPTLFLQDAQISIAISYDALHRVIDMSKTTKKLSTNQLDPNSLTCQNTGESLKTKPRFTTNMVVPTPIYNMRVTIEQN